MPSFENFIQHLDCITNITNSDVLDEYYNYLDFSEFDQSFEQRVATQLGGYVIEINHSYYKPIKYNDYYIILDWSLYRNENGNDVGDIIIRGYKNMNDLIQKLSE
jgi:hypothetical protein